MVQFPPHMGGVGRMEMRIAVTDKLSASSKVADGPAILMGMLIGTDGSNNPTVTVYNSTDNSGAEVVPTAEYDATVIGLNGYAPGYGKSCKNGIYCEISCAGAVEVVIDYIPLEG